jgi:hypothetical protein
MMISASFAVSSVIIARPSAALRVVVLEESVTAH